MKRTEPEGGFGTNSFKTLMKRAKQTATIETEVENLRKVRNDEKENESSTANNKKKSFRNFGNKNSSKMTEQDQTVLNFKNGLNRKNPFTKSDEPDIEVKETMPADNSIPES